MEEGVIMWAIFTKEGKAALRMDYEVHPENGKVGYGRLLSPDVSVLHEILTPDDADRFLSLPEYGISIRIRMRLRYQGTEDRVVKQSEYEPEMCFPVWIVPHFSVHVRYFFMKPQKYRINHMRPNRIYITGILLLFAFLSGRAQQPRIDELECRNLKIGYEKTLHMIFPTPVKYLNMGDENIIGEVIQVCPSVIRLKSTVRDFKGETNLSVVTEDSRYYTYCISFDEGAQAVYKEGGTMPETAVLPVSDEKLTHVIYPEKIVYVDFGNTTVQVEKAENVNNIVALRAVSPFALQTNLTAITESGRFYTFDLRYAPGCERFSFIVDKQDTKRKQVAILEGRERNTRQKALLEKEISRRPKLLTNIRDEVAGMRFCVTNIFVDNDILLFRFGLHNRSQIGYTMDFIRFYIQDAKKRKKTAVQQLEQQPLFSFNRPEEVAALSSCDFTVALPKFTIPDKKVLIIEIQERNGGRHFYYKLKNKQLINAEILFPEIVGKP